VGPAFALIYYLSIRPDQTFDGTLLPQSRAALRVTLSRDLLHLSPEAWFSFPPSSTPSGATLQSYLGDLCARCVKTSSFNQPTVNSEEPKKIASPKATVI
jgi:hypothetical protein